MKFVIKTLFIVFCSSLVTTSAIASKASVIDKTHVIVDKTPFFKAVIEDKNKIVLITRPHSWGGSFNMVHLENFFMPNMNSDCCENKSINYIKRQHLEMDSARIDKKTLDKYFGKYPTILVDFRTNQIKDVSSIRNGLTRKIWGLYNKFYYLARSPKLSDEDKEILAKYYTRNSVLTDDDIKNSIRFLSDVLYKHFEMPVIILFNKYDDFVKSYATMLIDKNLPIHEDEDIKRSYELHNDMMQNALYNNPHLYKSLIMGTTKVSSMKLWNKLPKYTEDSMFSPKWGDYFGFTKKELTDLLKECKVENINEDMLQKIKLYYGGYKLGNQDIYNPAAIMKMLSSYKVYKELKFDYIRFIPIIGDFSSPARKGTIQNLINGKSIDIVVDPNISYMDLGKSAENFYAMMFLEGYLTATRVTIMDNGKYKCRVKIPNIEMQNRFMRLISDKPFM